MLKVNHKVRVIARGSDRYCLTGKITEVRLYGRPYQEGNTMVVVKLDNGGQHIGHTGTVERIK